jgi:hypothetical protein
MSQVGHGVCPFGGFLRPIASLTRCWRERDRSLSTRRWPRASGDNATYPVYCGWRFNFQTTRLVTTRGDVAAPQAKAAREGLAGRNLLLGLTLLFRRSFGRLSSDNRLFMRCKKLLAAGAEVLALLDHAGRYAIDIRNCGTAKPECIGAAELLLLVRVAVSRCRKYRKRKCRRERCAEFQNSNVHHTRVLSPSARIRPGAHLVPHPGR